MSDYPPPPPPPPPPPGEYGEQPYQQYQPYQPYGGYQPGPPPPNNLVWAILTTIFCCQPPGIVAIVYAAQVNSKWFQGDHAGAQQAAKNARTWSIVAASSWLVLIVLYIGFIIAVSVAGSGSSSEF